MNGRAVVALFVAAALLAGGLAVYMRYTSRATIRDAQLTVLPTLKAKFALGCVDPASPDPRTWRDDGCPASATLTMTPESSFGDGTKSVLYVLVSGSGAIVGKLEASAPARIPLARTAAGRNVLVEVLSSAPIEPRQLEELLAREPNATADRRLELLRAFVDEQRARGRETRLEGRPFEVLASAAKGP